MQVLERQIVLSIAFLRSIPAMSAFLRIFIGLRLGSGMLKRPGNWRGCTLTANESDSNSNYKCVKP
jgi:hypothetical protein